MSISTLRPLPTPPLPTTTAERIEDLKRQINVLAAGQIGAFVDALNEVARLGALIADGGEAYPVGVRELARRRTEEAAKDALTVIAIVDRVRS